MDHLGMLNRAYEECPLGPEAKRKRDMRVLNYQDWFDKHGIPVYEHDGVYALVHPYKRSLAQIHAYDPFNYGELATRSGVHIRVICNMLASVPVAKEDAEKALAELGGLIRGAYSLDTVNVVLIRQE